MAVEISGNTASLNRALTESNNRLNQLSKNVSTTAKGLIAGFGLYEIGSGIIRVTSEFQKFEAVLTNTLGDQSKAQKALRDIEAFAAQTPFQVNEVTAAYVRWANQGLDPTIDRMGKLGDIASSLGAGFEQTAEAFKDLMVGQTKRIEEVGISATQMNGKIQLSFKGVNIEIEKNAEGVQKALDIYSQLNGVLGTSDAISKTLGGRISNLKDSWDLLLKTLGEANSGVLYTTVNILTRLVQGLAYTGVQLKLLKGGVQSLTTIEFEKLFNFGETDSLKKIKDVVKEINDLNSNTFFKNIEENKKRFIDLLVKEGETQEVSLQIWTRYVDLRLRAANDEDDAIQKKREAVKIAKDEVKVVKELNNELAKFTDKEMAGEQAIGLGSKAGFFDLIQTASQKKIDENILGEQAIGLGSEVGFFNIIEGVKTLDGELKILNGTLDNQSDKVLDNQMKWVNFGLNVGNAISGIISADKDLRTSLKKTAAIILQQNAQIIASELAKAFSKQLSSGDPYTAPARATAVLAIGIGVVAGLLGKDWKKNKSNTSGASSSGRVSMSGAQNSTQVNGVIRGQDIYISNQNYFKYNRSTSFIGG